MRVRSPPLADPDMSEPLADELSVYLRCARDELLLDTSLEQDPFRPHRARRIAAALTHLIARSEVLGEVEAALEPKVDVLLEDAISRSRALGAQERREASDPESGAPAWTRVARLVDSLSKMAPQSPAAADACHSLICRIRELEESRLSLTQTAMNDLAAADARRLASRSSELPPLTAEEAASFLRTSFASHPGITLKNFSQSKGVNSKENYQFEIIGLEDAPVPAILRRDRNFEIVPTSASREFELLNELRARGLPVAHCLAVQYDDAAPLRRPSLLMVRAAGSPLRKVDAKTLARIDPKLATPDLILQLADPLARLHSTRTEGLPLPGLTGSGSNRARFLALLADYHQRLHRFQREPFPIFEAAFAFLYANAHLIDDRVVLVHADYDLRNVLFDKRRLSVILDFELAHLGHPAEDLGYLRNDIEPLMPWSDFLAAYQAAGGPSVADELVRYFQIWAWAFRGSCNVTAFSGYRGGVHGDVFLGTLSFVETLHVQRRLIEMLPRT
jgi:aminoglycoside phosphotransferase (APT) family kinase protein